VNVPLLLSSRHHADGAEWLLQVADANMLKSISQALEGSPWLSTVRSTERWLARFRLLAGIAFG